MHEMEAYEPYRLRQPRAAPEPTLFGSLFPAESRTAVVAPPAAPATPRDDIAIAAGVPSPSAWERVRAWETVPARDVSVSLHSPAASSSGGGSLSLELADALRRDGAARPEETSRGHHASGAVPFSARVREAERRFREQMEVHRELTAAARQADVLQHAVKKLHAERRTRAVAQALVERQEAVWARVWPGGSPATREAEAVSVQRGAASPTERVRSSGASAAMERGGTASAVSVASTASPPPPASPTGSLLQSILDTFSKPRAQRKAGDGAPAATSSSAAPPPPASPAAVPATPAARQSVRGVEIVRPEAAPRPYPVIRWVQRRPTPLRHPLNGVAAPAEAPPEVSVSEELTGVAESVTSPRTTATASVTEDGANTAASTTEDVYDADTFDSDVSSEPLPVEDAPRSSATHSVASARSGSYSSVTESVASDDHGSRAARRRDGSEVSDASSAASTTARGSGAAAPLADVMRAFFDACRRVSAASTRLLQSPEMAGADRRGTAVAPHHQETKAVATNTADGSAADATWRAALDRQLRHVRHLQRFRDHLLRQIERLDVQRQAHQTTTRLLRQTQGLAKVRDELLSGAAAAGDESLAARLNRLGASTAAAKGAGRRGAGGTARRPPIRRAARVSASVVSDDVVTVTDSLVTAVEGSDSILDEVATAVNSSAVKEVMDYDGSDASSPAESDSVVEEDMGDNWDAASEYDTVVDSGGGSGSGSGESYGSDSFEAASDAGRSSRLARAAGRGSGRVGGLDEIEEELASHLAELSSDAIADGGSIPSEVEELIDMLPSSLIPSEVSEVSEVAATTPLSRSAVSSTSTAARRRARQRRVYAGVKADVARHETSIGGGGGGGVTDHKSYMRDSPGSSVYSVPEDADVDASVRQSTEGPSIDTTSASHSAVVDAEVVRLAEQERQSDAPQTSAATSATPSASVDSSSEDALTALEVDMRLTKSRRREQLRAATTVATFHQLYDPTVSPPPGESEPRSSTSSGSSGGGSSVCVDPAGLDAAAAADAAESALSSAVAGPRISTRADAGTQAVADPDAAPPRAAAEAARARAVYPVEDYVAQGMWKARQLHLLRELRTAAVDDAVRHATTTAAPRGGGDGAAGECLPRRTGSGMDVALDSAEAAAREEWAQHWGVVESLLQTRFAAARHVDAGRLLPSPSPSPSPRLRRPVLSSRSSDSPHSSRDSASSGVHGGRQQRDR